MARFARLVGSGLRSGRQILAARLFFMEVGLAAQGLATEVGADGIVSSHGISAFGDLRYPANFRHFGYADPEAPKGGTLVLLGNDVSNSFDSLNRFALAGTPAAGLHLVYDTLLTPALDEPDAVYGLLAERITFPQDRSWVVFALRRGARFADGTPVTARDVAFTFETLASVGHPAYRSRLADVATVTVLSEHELRVAFRPGAATRDLIAEIGQIEILPAHRYAPADIERSGLDSPLGSGPYQVTAADAGRSVTYCRNPGYWGADLPVNAGRHNFDCYRYEYFADPVAAQAAFRSGAYLFHEERVARLWATGYDFPAAANGWIRRGTVADDGPASVQGFWFNLRRPQFADLRVRKAVARLFNFEWTNATLLHGLYRGTDSFWEGTRMQAEGLAADSERRFLETFGDRLPAGILERPAVVPPVHSEHGLNRDVLRLSSALLDAAGWPVGPDGLRHDAGGTVLALGILSDHPGFEPIAVPFIEALKRLGISARFEQVDSAQMQERLKAFDYDLVAAWFTPRSTPSVELRARFGSLAASILGSPNWTGLADPLIDEVIEAVIAAPDRDTQAVRTRALDRLLREKHLWVPHWHRSAHWLAWWDVLGHPAIQPANGLAIDTWWHDAQKHRALREAGALR